MADHTAIEKTPKAVSAGLGKDAGPAWPAWEEAGGRCAAGFLIAMHRCLQRDLRRLADRVEATPVTRRDRWQGLGEDWERFAVVVRHCFGWERLHLWPLLAAAHCRDRERHAAAALGLVRSRLDAVEAMVESSRPVFERLAHARDEDAAATLRARVRAACHALEESWDAEEDTALRLLCGPVGPPPWRHGLQRMFEDEHGRALELSLPWLLHERPLETSTLLATGWSGGPGWQPTAVAATTAPGPAEARCSRCAVEAQCRVDPCS